MATQGEKRSAGFGLLASVLLTACSVAANAIDTSGNAEHREQRRDAFCEEIYAITDFNAVNNPDYTRDLARRYDDVVLKNLRAGDGVRHTVGNLAENHLIVQYPLPWLINQGFWLCDAFHSGVSDDVSQP